MTSSVGKISIANVSDMEKIDISNAPMFNIDFETINTIWESDMRMSETHFEGENDLIEQEFNKLIDAKEERINEKKKAIKKLEKQIEDEEDKDVVKVLIDKKSKLKKEIAKEESTEIKRPKSLKKRTEQEDKKIAEYAVENGKLVEYIKSRLFSTTTDGYYYYEDDKLEFKNDKQIQKLRKKLDAKHKSIAKLAIDDVDRQFKCEVIDSDEQINLKTKKINLARPFNFKFNSDAKVDKKNGEKILDFIFEVISGGSEEEYECILNILSYASHRKQSQVILFLCALGGVGKTFFTNIISKLFGDAYANANEQVLSGDTEFNDMLRGSVFATLEETSGKGSEMYKRLMRTIKEYATSEKIVTSKKFVDSVPVLNILNIMILSNYIDVDISDRRVFTPSIDNKYQNNEEYFSGLHDSMTTDALQYIFNYLHSREIPKKIKIPETTIKNTHKEDNMHSGLKYLLRKYMIESPAQENKVAMNVLFKQYQQWAEKSKEIVCKSNTKFHFMVQQYVDKVTKSDGTPMVSSGYQFYNVSFDKLYERIITRSKLITPERFEGMKEAYVDECKERKSLEEDENDYDHPFAVDELKTLRAKNAEMALKIEEMQKIINSMNKEKEPKTDKKKKNDLTNTQLDNLIGKFV